MGFYGGFLMSLEPQYFVMMHDYDESLVPWLKNALQIMYLMVFSTKVGCL